MTALSYPICLEVDTNTVTVWRSQREEPNLTGRGFTNLGVVCVCVDFYSFFWSEEASFRRCSVFKAQTRRGSVFQAAEVVMKAGGGQSGVSVSGGEGRFWLQALLQLTNQQVQKTFARFSWLLRESSSPLMHHCADIKDVQCLKIWICQCSAPACLVSKVGKKNVTFEPESLLKRKRKGSVFLWRVAD